MSEGHNRYCPNCDKWLNNKSDYKKVEGKCVGCGKNVYEGINVNCSSPKCKNESCKKCSVMLCYCNGIYSYTPSDSTSNIIECSTCGTEIEREHVQPISLNFCEYCGKEQVDKCEWDKHKPNWQEKHVISHEKKPGRVEKSLIGDKKYNKITINHDCWTTCKNCKQKKKLEEFFKDGELIEKNTLYVGHDAYCQVCRVKEEREQKEQERQQEITDLKAEIQMTEEAIRSGWPIDSETKKDLAKTKKRLAELESNKNRERERERERAELPNYGEILPN